MPRRGAIVGAVLGACFALAMPRVATAQSEACDELIHAGVEARRAGRDGEALDAFAQAWSRCRRARERVQMAWALQALGRWVEAAAQLRGALEAGDDPWVEARRAQLAGDLAAMDAHVGHIEVLSDAPGAELWIDGAAVTTLPMPAPLPWSEGEARVELRRAGHPTVSRRVVVAAGAVTRERFAWSAPPPAAPAAPRPSATRPAARAISTRRALGVGLAAGAGASLIGAAITYAYGLALVHAYNDDASCPGIEAAEQSAPCADRIRTSRAMGAASAVELGVGVALAVGAVVVLVTGARASPTTRAGLVCGGGSGPLGLGCALRF